MGGWTRECLDLVAHLLQICNYAIVCNLSSPSVKLTSDTDANWGSYFKTSEKDKRMNSILLASGHPDPVLKRSTNIWQMLLEGQQFLAHKNSKIQRLSSTLSKTTIDLEAKFLRHKDKTNVSYHLWQVSVTQKFQGLLVKYPWTRLTVHFILDPNNWPL